MNEALKRSYFRLIVLCLSFVWIPAGSSFAQFYYGSQLEFGKNRVQYNDFLWSYFRFENFDTYFYLNGKELALFTANYANEQIGVLEQKMETSLSDKIQFIIFNTHSDYKQSNLGYDDEEAYNTGGETRVLDQKIFLYFDGNHEHFKRQIRNGIVTVLLNQLLYGSSLTAQVKNSTLLFLPDWYLQGLKLYFTEGWSTTTDNRVRDGILQGRYRKFNRLNGMDAAWAGQSLWQFVADKYGPGVISDILYMAKISKNVESGFLFQLGVSFKSLVKEWAAHYENRYAPYVNPRLPELSDRLKLPGRDLVYTHIKINPEGRYAAYTTNNSGQYKVVLYDLEKKKRKTIFKRGFKLDDAVDYSYPLLAWHPSGKLLSFITEEKGKTRLYFYTPGSCKTDMRFLFQFDKILSFSYSPDGKSFILSAVIKGQSDLFLYNIAANSYEQLTRDVYDDLYPAFLNNGKQIIFSSNREHDTLRPITQADYFSPQQDHYDLFVLEPKSGSKQLKRITQTPLADEIQAMEYSKGYFTYLSDESGIRNRYLASFDSAVSFIDTTTHYRYFTRTAPVTDYSQGIEYQDISPKAGKAAEIVFHKNTFHLYVSELPDANKLPTTKLQNSIFMTRQLESAEKARQDSARLESGTAKKRKRFVTVTMDEQDQTDTLHQGKPEPSYTKIDINNYVFDKQAFIKLSVRDTLPARAEPLLPVEKAKPLIPKQLIYQVEYSINKLVSQVDFTYLNTNYQAFSGNGYPIFLNPGFNAFLKVGISDLLENHRVTGGVRLSFNLRNNEYLLSYSNLKHRLDKELTFHRQVLENSSDGSLYSILRMHTHEVYYRVSWPFNQVLSARATATYRNDRTVFLAIDDTNLRIPNVYRNWTGLKAELVFDATRNLGINLYTGTRYKIFSEYWQQVNPDQTTLFVLGADFRNYQRIHRTLIWANRFAASTSFGNNKLIYYMGGVDNWLAPRFNSNVPVATDNNYAYQTLATNMRGFEQNIRNGNSFTVLNSELRWPVFRYFANRPIKSDFINNFQVVAFGDIGTAWNGPSPWSKENSLYKKVIRQGPMTITVENDIEPVVGGYGLGLRTRFLGYFMRADWAWGVEDMKVQNGLFYFSLSLDF